MFIAIFPLALAVIGFLVWFMNEAKPKPWAKFGLVCFAVGLLVTTYVLAAHTIHIP